MPTKNRAPQPSTSQGRLFGTAELDVGPISGCLVVVPGSERCRELPMSGTKMPP